MKSTTVICDLKENDLCILRLKEKKTHHLLVDMYGNYVIGRFYNTFFINL